MHFFPDVAVVASAATATTTAAGIDAIVVLTVRFRFISFRSESGCFFFSSSFL